MTVIVILSLSVILQFLAAFFAVRLIKISGNRYFWIFITLALSMMLIRRVIPLIDFFYKENLASINFFNEIIGLFLSGLMFAGILGMKRHFLERNVMEDILKNKEKVFDLLADGYFLINTKGIIKEVNNAYSKLSGYSKEELIGLHIANIEANDNEDEIKARMERINKAGFDFFRTLHRSKSGELFSIDVSINKIIENNEIFYVVVMRDVTEKSKFEATVREEMEKLDDFFNLNLDLLCIADINGRFIKLNSSWYEVLGYMPEELINKEFINFVHEDDRQSTIDAVNRLKNQEKVTHFVNRYKTKQGEYKYIEWKSAPKGTFIYAAARDITKNKIIEESLRESEERFKALHNASFGGIAIHDKGIILDCNKGLSEMTGFSNEELIGMNGLLLIEEKSREIVMNNIVSGYEKPYEVEGVRKNGEEYPLRIEGRMIPYKGKMVRVVEFRDITEIKNTEKALIAMKEQAEKANKAKSEFLSNMSHEIRTPMNGIMGFTEILTTVETDREKLDYLNIIKNSSMHLLNLINDILSLAKIEAGKYESELKSIDLKGIFDNISDIYTRQCEQKGIEFRYVYFGDRKRWKTSEKSILQVLNNLLSNSLKFTESGYIELKVMEKNENSRNYIEVTVKDTGIGISPEKFKRLFEPFEQGEHYLNKKYGGTGLGLSIVKRVVEIMNGKLDVKTTEGKGTEFTVIIPVYEYVENDNKTYIKREVMIEKKGVRILSAEDFEVNQRLIETYLKNEGIDLVKASNGRETLEILKRESIDLILMDIQMPELNGIATAREIRKNKYYDNIPIIGVSAYALEEDIKSGMEAGMNDYISKPLTKEKLMECINIWIRKREDS